MAEAGWWDETWLYRRAINLENSTGTATNAQIKIFDGEDLSALVTAGKLQSSLSDLRFTDFGGNLLQYYIEDDTNASAEVWILIPSIPNEDSTIFMYYGNSSASSASSTAWMADIGGETSLFGDYRIHAFLDVGESTYTNFRERGVEHLIVAGGGGGGSRHGGGGGAGGIVQNINGTPLLITPQSYNIIVGDGGQGASAGSSSSDSTNGNNSSAFGKTAIGGGKGTSTATPGSGGSGGGSRGNNTYSSGGDGIAGQGNRGGRGNSGGSMMGGGGGGYSEPGKDADVPNEGNGGGGFNASTFFGTNYGEGGWFAGGGGGGNSTGAQGGQGGGGDGGGPEGASQDGVAGTGGGGGAGGMTGSTNYPGKAGGSGIVLVRYQSNVDTPTNITIGSPSATEEISPGPVAYWKFDEGSGTTAHDSSGQGNDGILVNGPTWQIEEHCINGKCLYFDGNDGVTVADDEILNTTGVLSIILWVKPLNISGRIALLNRSSFSSTSNGYSFEIHDGNPTLVINGGRTAGSIQKCNESISTNEFSHVGWTRNNHGNNKLYINGKECTYESTINSEQISTNTTLGIGSKLGKQSLPPFTDYSNKNYNSPYTAGCWGGDAATITYYSTEGYNDLPYKKLTKTTGGTGGCYITEHSTFPIEDSKNYIISAWMKASQTVTLNGYAIDLNRASDNAYRTGTTPILNTSWQRVSWIYNSGLNHAGNYQSRQIIYVDNDLPLDVYWSDFQVEDTTGTGYIAPSLDFHGYLDEIKIYAYTRNEDQIKSDYIAGASSKGSAAVFGHKTETAQVTPISSKLVAHWRFDEGYGTTAYNSGFGGSDLVGTLGAGTSAPTWTNEGRVGKALSFDGGDYVQLTSSSLSFTQNTGSMTASAWVNINSLSGSDKIIFAVRDSGSVNWQIGKTTTSDSGKIRYYNGTSYDSNSQISVNQWAYVAVTVDGPGNSAKIYLNGKLDSTFSTNFGSDDGGNLFTIGSVLGSFFWPGLIDEVKIYNTALTPEEILQDYNQGMAAVMGQSSANTGSTAPAGSAAQEYCVPGSSDTCRPPVAEWKLDEKQGNTTYDTSGNNNEGTLFNSPTWRSSAFCKEGGCLEFDGGGNAVFISDNNSIKPTTGVTIQAWMKANSDLQKTIPGNLTPSMTIEGHGSSWVDAGYEWNGLAIYRNTVTNPDAFNNFGFRSTTSVNLNQSGEKYITLTFWVKITTDPGPMQGYINVYYTDATSQNHSWSYKPNPFNNANYLNKWTRVTSTVALNSSKTPQRIQRWYVYKDNASQGQMDVAGIQIEQSQYSTSPDALTKNGSYGIDINTTTAFARINSNTIIAENINGGQFNHVSLTHDGSTQKLYVNGHLKNIGLLKREYHQQHKRFQYWRISRWISRQR